MKNKCPICEIDMPGPWQEWPQYPFCTPRCKLIDLGRWLGEDYKVARPAREDENQTTEPPSDA